MKVTIRQFVSLGESAVATIDWPPAYALPRVGERIQFSAFNVFGRVASVTWYAETPEGYPHMTEWSIVIELE